MPKLVFFGNEQLATGLSDPRPRVLPALLSGGYEVAAVILPPLGTVRRHKPLAIERFAAAHRLPVHRPADRAELVQTVRGLDAVAGVLVAYGQIVPDEVIDSLPDGIINLHPSLLPKLRGASPIEQTILDGAERSGVSLMKLTGQLDAGPLYAQQAITLSGQESKDELADRMLRLGAELLVAHIEDIVAGRLMPKPQNDRGATYTKRLTKSQGIIDPTKPADLLARQIRAYSGWPASLLRSSSGELIITAVTLKSSDQQAAQPGLYRQGNELALSCRPGLLVIDRLKPANQREMSGRDWLNAHPEVPGL